MSVQHDTPDDAGLQAALAASMRSVEEDAERQISAAAAASAARAPSPVSMFVDDGAEDPEEALLQMAIQESLRRP